MLLQRLAEHGRSLDPTPRGYGPTPIGYRFDLDGGGHLRPSGIVPLTGSTKADGRGIRRLVPTAVRAAGIKPLLLADNAEYTLGVSKGTKSAERVAEQHDAYVQLVRECAAATGLPTVRAVLTFLESKTWTDTLPRDFDPTLHITFTVGGRDLVDQPAIRAFWGARLDREATSMHVCLVCGDRKPVLERFQLKVKGIPGGQTAGTSLVSANAGAFESYGLRASHVAPTCASCAEDFTKGLNALLASREHSLRIADAVVHVFWTSAAADFDLAKLLTEPEPQDVRRLLQAAKQGDADATQVDAPRFFLAILSASGGRAVVRDFDETSLANAQDNLRQWFRALSLGDDLERPLALYPLVASLTHDPRKDTPARAAAALMETAVLGRPLPEEILFLAVRRCRAEKRVTRPRAALLRLALLKNPKFQRKENDLMTLDTENREPAYLCGRLLAELENAQRVAQGTTNATVVDKFYGSASSTPALVFGPLLRNSKNHLTKLRKTSPGAHAGIEGRIMEIADGLGGKFPTTLNLAEQAVFALGYYHQRAAGIAAARERRASTDVIA